MVVIVVVVVVVVVAVVVVGVAVNCAKTGSHRSYKLTHINPFTTQGLPLTSKIVWR